MGERMRNITDVRLLPEDLVMEIIEWLPVKSISRFSCVSKKWRALFKSPCFINNHLVKQQQSDPRVLLLWKSSGTPLNNEGALYFHDLETLELDEVCPRLSIPLVIPESSSICVLECNGLVCLVINIFGTVLKLCNPALREYKVLPCRHIVYPTGYVSYSISKIQGFGITCNGDYKVVVIWRFEDIRNKKAENQVHLFNLSSSLWTRLDDLDLKIKPIHDVKSSHVFFNGACHWHALSYHSDLHNVIVSFNLTTEIFEQLEYPDCLTKVKLKNSDPYFLINLNSCIGFIQVSPQGIFEVWLMKEYGLTESWTKQFVMGPYPSVHPLMPWKNEKWILAVMGGNQLVSCALDKLENEKFDFYGDLSSFTAPTYKESLISLYGFASSVPTVKLV